MSLPATGPNAAQIEYWNEQSGPKWVALQERLDGQIEALGRSAMERAAIAAGERVVDVGCGTGQTSLQLAERVGRGGSVLGVDISTVMLERARERACDAGLTNVRFENADAHTHAFEPGAHDVLFSRFGVMFFTDPPAAFANLARALRPGGRLGFVCWRGIEVNPWMLVPLMALAQHVELPPRPEPGEPGPFSFADPDRVRSILETAGFAEIALDPIDPTFSLGGGGDVDAATTFVLEIGPAAAALREASEGAREKAAGAVREALAPYETPEGVQLTGGAWLVTATHPAS